MLLGTPLSPSSPSLTRTLSLTLLPSLLPSSLLSHLSSPANRWPPLLKHTHDSLLLKSFLPQSSPETTSFRGPKNLLPPLSSVFRVAAIILRIPCRLQSLHRSTTAVNSAPFFSRVLSPASSSCCRTETRGRRTPLGFCRRVALPALLPSLPEAASPELLYHPHCTFVAAQS